MTLASSCIYSGTVWHGRRTPVRHEFRYRLQFLYVNLDDFDTIFQNRWLWSTTKPRPGGLRRADFPGNPKEPIAESIRRLLRAAGQSVDEGDNIFLLTLPRICGFVFNPLSLFYSFSADGTLRNVVADVRNIPWFESHVYVLSSEHMATHNERTPTTKTFHVSPFLPMNLTYRWQIHTPSETLRMGIEVVQEENEVLQTTLNLKRQEITSWNLAKILACRPWGSFAVPVQIYWEAAKLWWKGCSYFPHPNTLPFQKSSAATNADHIP